MASQFRATTPNDFDQIAELATRAFGTQDNNPFRDRPYQQWKYWQPWEGQSGSRSYVIEQDGRFVAHGCAWPVRLLSEARSWRGMYLIDWVADATVAGKGVILLKRMAAMVDFMCIIGGSEQTRALTPKLGFRSFNEMVFAARPMRPLRQILTHQHRNWKLPIRLVRNTLWRHWPLWPATGGWKAAPCTPREVADKTWARPSPGWMVAARDAAMFEHLLACPAVKFRFYRLSRQGEERGYFCLSVVAGQARIADLWIRGDESDWVCAYALAMREALRDREVAEIETVASFPAGYAALEQCGFRPFSRSPIGMLGSKDFVADSQSFQLQMADADFAFVHEAYPEYQT